MKNIFISYRRKESSGYSRLVYDRLRVALPDWDIFMDVEDIPVGENWREVLGARIASADIMIVLIGRDWLTMTESSGARRLDNPEDVTRWEIASALEKEKHLVPVLLEGVPPPAQHELPDLLAPLATMQHVTIRHETFNADLENLITRITGRGLRETLRWERGRRMLERTRRWSVPVIALLMLVILWVGLLDLFTLETRTTTWSLALADMLFPPQLEANVALVAIPETFTTHAPSARATYADLVTRLSEAGASVILLDLVFHTAGEHDQALAAALTGAAGAGTQVFFGFTELEQERPRAVPMLAQSAAGLGLVCVGRRLGYTMMMPIAINYRPPESANAPGWISDLPGLALLGAAGRVSVDSLDPESMLLTLAASQGGKLQYPISLLDRIEATPKGCKALRADTQAGLILLRLSPLQALRGDDRRFAMNAVLANQFDADRIRGRTVIVGLEASEEEFTVAYGLGSEQRYGYELYADAINTLVTDRVAQPLTVYPQILLLLALSSLGAWLGIRLFGRPAVVRRLAIALLLSGYVLLSVYLIAEQNLLLHTAYDLFGLVAAYLLFRRFSSRWLV